MIRKNAVPIWTKFSKNYCISCGSYFKEGEKILSSNFCNKCGLVKEKELKLRTGKETDWTEFRSVCIKCAKPHKDGEELLFGIYCIKCGKNWIKARDIRAKNLLKKARNIAEKVPDFIQNTNPVGIQIDSANISKQNIPARSEHIPDKTIQKTLDPFLFPVIG